MVRLRLTKVLVSILQAVPDREQVDLSEAVVSQVASVDRAVSAPISTSRIYSAARLEAVGGVREEADSEVIPFNKRRFSWERTLRFRQTSRLWMQRKGHRRKSSTHHLYSAGPVLEMD